MFDSVIALARSLLNDAVKPSLRTLVVWVPAPRYSLVMNDAAFNAEQFLNTLTRKPGVYRMFDSQGDVLYVGKALNLKKRVSSYFRAWGLATKTMAMVAKIHRIETTVTKSETEALLLEQSLIKTDRPPYNILLRDDKSYPFVHLSTQSTYPRLSFHRGLKKGEGKYFGPFPSAAAVRDSLNVLQKLFQIRQCEESYFKNRSRPCLQHQIQRCSAPCVGFVSEEEYAEDVDLAILFLQGKSIDVLDQFKRKMEAAAEKMDYERRPNTEIKYGSSKSPRAPCTVQQATWTYLVVPKRQVKPRSRYFCSRRTSFRSANLL